MQSNNGSNSSSSNNALLSELGVGLAKFLNACLAQSQQAKSASTAPTTENKKNPFLLFCTVAPISLEEFGSRLGRYFACSPACFEVALVYLSRVQASHPHLFEPLSVFKLMLAALTIAVKFSEDQCCPQVHYAKCGGIETWELNSLESLFYVELLQFRASVSEAELRVASVVLTNTRTHNHQVDDLDMSTLAAQLAICTPRSQALVVPQNHTKINHASF